MPKRSSALKQARKAHARDAVARSEARAGASTLDSFVNFQMALGIGADNALSTGTYGYNPITRNRSLLEWIHRGSWVGGVAVDVVADDMTRAGVEVNGAIDPDDLLKLEESLVSLAVWKRINSALKWSRLYGGALAVILIDGQDTATPLRINTIRKGQFCGLLVLDRWMVDPSLSDLITDFGPDLGLPKTYRVTGNAPALRGQTIHHSRCIRLSGLEVPYNQALVENLWGISVLERLYDRMVAFDSASTGAAQLVYKAYLRTMKVEGLREIVAAGGDALKGLTMYVDMMRRFQGIEGTTLIDSKDELTADAHSAFGGLSDALAQFGQQLSGALQIPLVRLFGQSPTGFSTGETDLRNYYDSIKMCQERDLRVGVTKIYRIAAASEGIELPEGTRIEFRSLWDLTATDKANIAQTTANTVKDAEESGLISRATALKELRQSSTVTGVFSNITDEMIEEAEQEGPPVPEDVEVAEIRAGAIQPGSPWPRTSASEGPSEPSLASGEPSGAFNKVVAAGRKLMDRLRARDDTKRAAGILFVAPEGVLLLKRASGSDQSGTWGLPGGRIESGETELEAACRETLEETGFVVPGNTIQILESGGGFTTFRCSCVRFEPRLNHEHTEHRWEPNPLLLPDLHPNLRATLLALGSVK